MASFDSLRRSKTFGNESEVTANGKTLNADRSSLMPSNADIFHREIAKDDLLRILTSDKTNLENKALMLSETGQVEELSKLIDTVDLFSCKGMNGFTLLHHASNRGHALIVQELLSKTREIADIPSDSGETALHLAVYSGNMLIADQLIDYGCDINARNDDNETALFYAARKSMPALIRLLIQRGADINIRDKYGDLALDHCSHPSAVKAFQETIALDQAGSLPYKEILHIYSYLEVSDILRCACVSTKWHRVSEDNSIWSRLGIRRWEIALQNSLGFAPTATSSFFKLKKSSKNSKTSG